MLVGEEEWRQEGPLLSAEGISVGTDGLAIELCLLQAGDDAVYPLNLPALYVLPLQLTLPPETAWVTTRQDVCDASL